MTETPHPTPAAEWRAQQIEEGRRAIAAMPEERRADIEVLISQRPDLLGPELAEAFGLTPRQPKPLTVADIPAGQGPASLFIGPDENGHLAAWFKTADGQRELVMYAPMRTSPGRAAAWDHLAATLPHVTTEEEA